MLPEVCCQYCAIKGELVSRHSRGRAERLSLFRSHGLLPPIFTHTYSCMHTEVEEHLLLGEPSLQTGVSCLLPSVHSLSLPPSVRCIKFQGKPKMLLIWTYPRTELHHRSISAQPVKLGGFGGLLFPLTSYRAVHPACGKYSILLHKSWGTHLICHGTQSHG